MLVRTLRDLRAEQLLDGALDLDLVRAGRHLEDDRPAVLAQDRRLLGDQRPANDVGQFHDFARCRRPALPCSQLLAVSASCSRDAPASTTRRHRRRAPSPARSRTSATPGMLRTDRANLSSSATSMSTALPSTPSRFSSATAALVLISRRRQRVDDDQRAVLQLLGERRAQRAELDLLRQLEVVAARLRTEHRAALAPQRVADLADAGAAGALLPPRLLAAAADVARGSWSCACRAARRRSRARPTPRSDRRSRARRTPRRGRRWRRPSRCCC